MSGKLYIVGTPIGNLSDASPRSLEILRAVALIAAEDTRVTSKLLARFDIHTPLTASHEHNERGKAVQLVERMLSRNEDIALVTDAGMPCISDPGWAIVAAAREAGIHIECAPGPSAVPTILALTGWQFTEFAFYSFLPRVNGKLAEKLLDMSKGVGVAVVFESPYRVENLLAVLRDTLPDTRVFIANDLTKQYEWTLEGGVQDVLDAFKQRVKALKGEYCLAFRFPPIADEPEEETISAEAWILDALYSGKTMPEAVEYAQAHGVSRNEAYRASIGVKEFIGKR